MTMPRYSVAVPVFATTFFKCNASSPQEAIEKAMKQCPTPQVCCQCNSEIQVEEIDFNSLTADCVEEL
jgi:hypothetical protein